MEQYRSEGPAPIHHASVVALAVDADGPLIGLGFIGPSGSGKTSQAIGLVDNCPYHRTVLIADDLMRLHRREASVIASALPQARDAGGHLLAEARGAGLLRLSTPSAQSEVVLRYVIDLAAGGRMPDLSPWQPFGMAGPDLRRLGPAPLPTLRPLIRSLLTGHSLASAVDYSSCSDQEGHS